MNLPQSIVNPYNPKSYGTIAKATDLKGGLKFALKIIPTNDIPIYAQSKALTEAYLLEALRHPNILPCIEVKEIESPLKYL